MSEGLLLQSAVHRTDCWCGVCVRVASLPINLCGPSWYLGTRGEQGHHPLMPHLPPHQETTLCSLGPIPPWVTSSAHRASCLQSIFRVGSSGGELGVGAGEEPYRRQEGLEGGEGISLGNEHNPWQSHLSRTSKAPEN